MFFSFSSQFSDFGLLEACGGTDGKCTEIPGDETKKVFCYIDLWFRASGTG